MRIVSSPRPGSGRGNRKVCGIATLAVLALGPAAGAQSSDSLHILSRARQAQRDFERFRRGNLQADLDGGSPTCEERIGRFCYWYDPFPKFPPESEIVARARMRLLRDLAAAAGRLPGDDWILGQRVRYLVEQRRTGLAVLLARACRGTRWWCDALEGFARHAGGDYEGADHAFDRALHEMPAKQRCAWTDLSPLLRAGAREYRALGCAEREASDERIWWLAHPLYSWAGNSLRTEHYARHTMAVLLQHAENAYGTSWGRDARELLIRFGWPTHWSRSFRPGSLSPPSVVGHEASPSFWLFPEPVLTQPWSDVTQVQWEPTKERPPTRYAPPYARGFASIARVQFARFRRGDTTLTLAPFDLTPDSVLARDSVDVHLAVARDPATPVVLGRPPSAGKLGVAAVRTGWRPAVVSLEARGVKTGWVAWRRAMVPWDPAGLPPVLSDVLLFTPSHALPKSLEEASAAALAAPLVRANQLVGLYWEMYGTSDLSEPVQIAVTVTKAPSKHNVPYPVGRPECPARVASPVTLRWEEESGASLRGGARSIALDLRSLSRGRYVVAIEMSVNGRPRGCSSRELQIIARD